MVIKVISVLAKLEYDTPLSISHTLARAQNVWTDSFISPCFLKS